MRRAVVGPWSPVIASIVLALVSGVEAWAEGAPSAARVTTLLAALLVAGAGRAPVLAAVAGSVLFVTAYVAGVALDDLPQAIMLVWLAYGWFTGCVTDLRRSVAAITILLLGLYGGQGLLEASGFSPPVVFALTIAWAGARVLRSQDRLADDLHAAAAALEAERGAYVELAVVHERRAIARELHDIVGHAMSLVVIQAAAGRHLVGDADRALASLNVIDEAGEMAAVEVGRLREILGGNVSDVAHDGLGALSRLVAQVAAAGQRVSLQSDAEQVRLDPEVERAAMRILQEALTNTVRHAPGADVRVALTHGGDVLRVQVSNGPGRAGGAHLGSGGEGLTGMQERARAVGGTLRAGATEGKGWLLEAWLPVSPVG